MASSQTRPDKGKKRKVIDSDDDTSGHDVAEAPRSSKSRHGAPSPTPVPRKSTSSRKSVKRERSSSAGLSPAESSRERARRTKSLSSSSSSASSSASPYPQSSIPPPRSKAEQMAAKMRQDKLAAAARLQKKLRAGPHSSSSSAQAGPSRPSAASVGRPAPPVNAVASSSRLVPVDRAVASASDGRTVPGSPFIRTPNWRPLVKIDGRSIQVDNVARFSVSEAWKAFGQCGEIATIDEFITPKSNLLKVIFVTYLDVSSANRAIQTMSNLSFPLGLGEAAAPWLSISNLKPPLLAMRVKKDRFDVKTERWLASGGVFTHTKIELIEPAPEALVRMEDDMSPERESSQSEPEPAPPAPKKHKIAARARIESSAGSSDSEALPPPMSRPASVRPPVKVKKEDVIEILSSEDEMTMDDDMGMDEESTSSSGSDNDDDVPPPPPPPLFRDLPTFAPLRQPPAPPVVAPPADDSSDSDTSSDEEDEEARPSLDELFPEAGPSRLPRPAPRPTALIKVARPPEASSSSTTLDLSGGQGGSDLSCQICAERFPTYHMRREHVSREHSDVVRCCQQCPKLLYNSKSIKDHRKDHRWVLRMKQEDPGFSRTCGLCSELHILMIVHERYSHGIDHPWAPKGGWAVNDVGADEGRVVYYDGPMRSFSKKVPDADAQWSQHRQPPPCINDSNSEVESSSDGSDGEEMPQTKVASVRPSAQEPAPSGRIRKFGCVFCPERFFTHQGERTHMVNTHADQIHRCPDCPRVLFSPHEVRLHEADHVWAKEQPAGKQRICFACSELHVKLNPHLEKYHGASRSARRTKRKRYLKEIAVEET